jgi:hypothetical protein
VNILEFILTVISLINLISEIYIDTKENTILKINRKFHNNQKSIDTLQRIRYTFDNFQRCPEVKKLGGGGIIEFFQK